MEKTVKIPAGIDDGQKLKLIGMEMQVQQEDRLEIYVHVPGKTSSYFLKEMILTCIVTFHYCLPLQEEIEVPTLNGKKKVKITARNSNRKNDETFRRRNREVLARKL